MTITPDLAAKLLKRNHINRHLKRAHVMKLVRALKSGLWDHVNGATIILSAHQDLMDGQHRLTAVVESGVAITTLVVFGVPDAKRATIDTGASRSLGDYFSMKGFGYATSLSAVAGILLYWERGILLSSGRGNNPFVTFEEGMTFLAAHPGLETSVARAHKLPKLMRPSHMAFLDFIFEAQDTTLAEAWYTTMHTGVRVEPHQAFLVLRERLIRDKTEGIKRHVFEHVVFSLLAWNSARRGQTRTKFRWSPEDGVPQLL
jgi:hypothetical protein